MKRNTDLYGGLFMILVSLLFLSKISKLNEYSRLFPQAIIFLLIASGIGLIIKSIRKPTRTVLFTLDDRISAFLVAAITLAWVLLFKHIGFVVTGMVALTALLIVLNDKKNPKEFFKSFFIAGCLIAGLYLLFSRVLYVPFPRGLFF
ncbi:MAG: tripartite tricarboxylate transporter TctB family protein [Bacillota bacterium]